MICLKVPVYLTYAGSREYVNKKGETRTLYKFQDADKHEYENLMVAAPAVEPGTLCTCTLECGHRWIDTEKRYERYFRILEAQPAPKQK